MSRDPGYYSCDYYCTKDANGTVPCCPARHISVGRICPGKVVRGHVCLEAAALTRHFFSCTQLSGSRPRYDIMHTLILHFFSMSCKCLLFFFSTSLFSQECFLDRVADCRRQSSIVERESFRVPLQIRSQIYDHCIECDLRAI
jgi:hypothetical protein